MLVVLVFLLLETVVQLTGDHLLDAHPVLPSQRVKLAVASVVHIMGPHIASDLGVFVPNLQPFPLRVAVVLESDRIIGQAE